jgi:excinuclease ABC subunit C
LSDDKTYPYIKISTNEEYPSLSIRRKITNDNAKYFGPYGDVTAMRNSLNTIRKIFPVRICSDKTYAAATRPCTYYHIGQCSAPCADKITKAEYRSMINSLTLFLEGKLTHVIENIRSEMANASMKHEYERAAILRDRIRNLEKTVQQVRIVLPADNSLDAIAIYRSEESVCTHVLQIAEGKIVSSENFDLKVAEEASDEEALESFLKQYYLKRTYVPNRLILNRTIDDAESIAIWLSEKCKTKVKIERPSDRKLKSILDLAMENAKTYSDNLTAAKRKNADALLELKNYLRLEKTPGTIECFDISNLGERNPVGSKICFYAGAPNKREYRMYRIKTVLHQNDQAMIAEIIARRFSRLLKEEKKVPDLIVVDGGIPQVLAAKKQLDNLGITAPLIGLAKKREQIFLPNGEMLEPDQNSKSSLLLQHMRDEAHRFAINYHRRKREKLEEPS